MSFDFEVLVVGGGPAGAALFAACAEQGLETALIAPPRTRWPNNYGAWVDELEPLGLGGCFERTWPEAVIELGGERRHVLSRAYGRLDNERLAATLFGRAARARGAYVEDHALEARPEGGGTAVVTASGRHLRARAVLDASGSRPALVQEGRGRAPGVQVAYGVRAELDRLPFDPGQVVLMDFRDDHLDAEARAGVPSFLYAMDLGDGTAFLEETVLVSRPALPVDVLEARLSARLAHHGVRLGAVREVERCFIAMGAPRPGSAPSLAAFGSAGALIHPATGYMVALALRAAPQVAEALGRRRSGALEPMVWPTARRRAFALYRLGMEVLLTLDGDATRAFFDAFFRAPEPLWRGYLGATLAPSGVLRSMAAVFAGLPAGLRLRVMRAALGPGLRPLVDALRAR